MTVKELKDALKHLNDEVEIKIKLHVCDSDQEEIEETYTDILNLIVTTSTNDKSQTLDFECWHYLEEEESK